jgi:hypothetical protein
MREGKTRSRKSDVRSPEKRNRNEDFHNHHKIKRLQIINQSDPS